MESKQTTCYLFLAEGFEESEAVITLDVLRRGGLNVKSVSITGELIVTGGHQISLVADDLFENINFDDAQILILPGGMPGTLNLQKFEPLIALIKAFDQEKRYIAAICAAPLILGQLGLLEGEQATCYPGFENQLTGAELVDNKTIISHHLVTSRGVVSALEFALAIVRLLQGEDLYQQTAKGLLLL